MRALYQLVGWSPLHQKTRTMKKIERIAILICLTSFVITTMIATIYIKENWSKNEIDSEFLVSNQFSKESSESLINKKIAKFQQQSK